MKVSLCTLLLTAVLSTGCGTSSHPAMPLPRTGASTVDTTGEVRAFAASVARDVTRRGPASWRDYFVEGPAFFMVADGHMVFASGDAATGGIEEVARIITHIELRWQEPVRVDPLTPTLAVLAAPYYELRVDSAGHRVEETGYFTGLAERGPEGWKLRHAHWSTTNQTAHQRQS